MSEVKNNTIDRPDPSASFQRRRAAMRASWTPEVQAYAATLVAEIDFARRLREFREAFGLSQRQIADITGEDQGDISRLERRELNPSVERMNRILGRLRDYADTVVPVTAAPEPIAREALTTAGDAAAYLCAIYDDDDADFTMLKLQKLLYYAQGYALALLGRPLFGERIKAWEHGPVVPQVRMAYKDFPGLLPRPDDLDLLAVDPAVRAILDRVYAEFGQYAAWALRNMTHGERPWAETPQSEEIDRQLMTDFFAERLRKVAGER
jgi:uncharacterized phage-associated protein/ribosome-binding protein aMBF1 (putative translation factor)